VLFCSGAYLLREFGQPDLVAARRSAIAVHLTLLLGMRIDGKHTVDQYGQKSAVLVGLLSPHVDAGYQYTFWSDFDRLQLVQKGFGIELAGGFDREFNANADDAFGYSGTLRLHWLMRLISGHMTDRSVVFSARHAGEFTDYVVGFGSSL
jgi:hypothetical protein